MDADAVRAHCLAKPGAEETYPFGPEALVVKVGGKLFAILAEDEEPARVSLKCEPELAEVLRETYPAVVAGYHLNKRLWNTVDLDGSVPSAELVGWIDDSYDLVVEKLPKRVRDRLSTETGTVT